MSSLEHGGRLDAAARIYGGSVDEWLDLSTGINPVAYPVPEIPETMWARLPDSGAEHRLLDAAREYYGVPDHLSIVPANGTQALIQLMPNIIQARNVAIVSPTYGEHAHVWLHAGAHVKQVGELEGGHDCLVVVNPNNPTAKVRDHASLLRAAGLNQWVIVDEAFADPTPEVSIVGQMPDNGIVLKSVGKFFGLAGLRLGFAVCNRDIAGQLQALIGPWSVSGPALHVGQAALRDRVWTDKTAARLKQDSGKLALLLREAGFEVEGTHALFVSVRDPEERPVFETLAQHRILVRNFSSRPGYYRFGLCGDDAGIWRLKAALSELS